VTLEGVLTGVALGIVLIYMIEEEVKAAARGRGGGPLEGPGGIELGDFAGLAGRIGLAQPQTLTLRSSGQQREEGGQGPVDLGPGFLGGGGGLSLPRGARTPTGVLRQGGGEKPTAADTRVGADNNLSGGFEGGAADRGEIDAGQQRTTDETIVAPIQPVVSPDGTPDPLPPDRPTAKEAPLPDLMLILVRTEGNASSRSLGGDAKSMFSGKQTAIENSVLDLRTSDVPKLVVQSERLMPLSAYSADTDSVLDLINRHVDLVSSEILGGSETGTLILQAKDLLELVIASSRQAIVDVNNESSNLDKSSLLMGEGNNLVSLNALTVLQFSGLGDSTSADMAFELLTRNLRDSVVRFGAGDDRLMLSSGFYEGGDSFNNSTTDGRSGLTFELGDSALNMPDEAWQMNLKAVAIGAQDSLIDLGNGNNTAILLTRIDQSLAAELNNKYISPNTSIRLDRIGLQNTTLKAGDGDDDVRITGRVVGSTIDLGAGNNQLVLEEDVDQDSSIVLRGGSNKVLVTGSLGGRIEGGEGADGLEVSGRELAGSFDGKGGNDVLEGTDGERAKRDFVFVQGRDSGFFNSIRFQNVESVSTKGGDDVVIMALEGTLTGRCLGGSGLDRLEFSNWKLPVAVDLDLGTATAISGGISGIEQVVGGLGNDLLVGSGLHAELSGGVGDDVIWMRWTPWSSESGDGLKLSGGADRDLFVFDGIGAAGPNGWNGRDGLPLLVDLDLTDGIGVPDQLAWTQDVQLAEGVRKELIRTTASGLEGLGDIRLLPIAPLEQLLSGMTDATQQLAIAYDPAASATTAELHLLGVEGRGSSQAIALIPTEQFVQRNT